MTGRTPRQLFRFAAVGCAIVMSATLLAAPPLTAAAVQAPSVVQAAAAPGIDDLAELYARMSAASAGDYAAQSWAGFAPALDAARTVVENPAATSSERDSALAALQASADELVMVRGLRSIEADYATRIQSDYADDGAWQGLTAALATARAVLDDAGATHAAIATAKTALQTSAGALADSSGGTFAAIQNDSFWKDTDGNPIYSQGGGVFRFGDTYYWYGVKYVGAEKYYQNPARAYGKDVTFDAITVYSSHNLVDWTFENEIATPSTPLYVTDATGPYFTRMASLTDAIWLGRLGVTYNENTGKYTLFAQTGQNFDPDPAKQGAVLILQGDSPTEDFEYGGLQVQIGNNPTQSTGDQTVFTDEDGTDYLIFSNAGGRNRAFVSKISDADSMTIEPGVLVGYSSGQGREGNAMFRLGDRYYMGTSDLHGWNSSVSYIIESLGADVQGEYTSNAVLPGTEKDYSHVTQTGFYITVHGTEQDTVIHAGDRWAGFAWNGTGFNQWEPISETAGGLRFNSLSDWELNAVTGEWRVGDANNYALNPEFDADRITVSELTGWTNTTDADSATAAFVSNPSPGASPSRWALQLGNAGAFSGSVHQQNDVPDGLYDFALQVKTAGGLEYARAIIEGDDERYVLDLDHATTGWQRFSLSGLPLTGGTATIRIEARSAGGAQSITVDDLSLVRTGPASVWDSAIPYSTGNLAGHNGSIWLAAWSTQNQAPGDQNGPWQQLVVAENGLPGWTPSRVFTAGSTAVYQGTEYTAKWWTRNQVPGDPWGPWTLGD